jgi:hypothetical protein
MAKVPAASKRSPARVRDDQWRIPDVLWARIEALLPERHRGLARYSAFSNDERPHQSLGSRTSAAVYRGSEVEKG